MHFSEKQIFEFIPTYLKNKGFKEDRSDYGMSGCIHFTNQIGKQNMLFIFKEYLNYSEVWDQIYGISESLNVSHGNVCFEIGSLMMKMHCQGKINV